MAETFGARLRQRREARGIELDAIAEQTKLKRSLLDALERDDLKQWPAGIFRRSWIRTYACAIGLNGDEVVKEFLAEHPDPQTAAAEAAPQTPAPPAPGLRGLLGAAFGSLRRSQPDLPAPPVVAVAPLAVAPVREPDVDLDAIAQLCTDLGRMEGAGQMPSLLAEAGRLLGASGVIVWVWDHRGSVLRPAFVHGYTAEVVSRLPPVKRDSHNATAAAFRSGQSRVIAGGEDASAGFVVPLHIPPRCAGVLAVELDRGATPSASMCAVATILASAIAQVVARAKAAQAQARLAATSRSPVTPHPVHAGSH